jgi:hypothetical protein
MDEQGREILTFLPGRPGGGHPIAELMYDEATLEAVTNALRAYHDATTGFVAPAGAPWQFPAHAPVEVICHNDFAPDNLIFDGERLAGVIDFDLASPGPRVWDLAYTAYRFVPLSGPDNPDMPYPGPAEQARRLACLCAVYNSAAIGPRDVLDTAAKRLRDLHAFMHREAAAGNAAQQAIIDRGRGAIYERDVAYLERERVRLAAG